MMQQMLALLLSLDRLIRVWFEPQVEGRRVPLPGSRGK